MSTVNTAPLRHSRRLELSRGVRHHPPARPPWTRRRHGGGRYAEHDRRPPALRDFRRRADDKHKALDAALDGLSVQLDGLARTAHAIAGETDTSTQMLAETHGALDSAEAALRNHRALKGQHLPSGPRGGRRRHRLRRHRLRRRRVVSDPATSAAANMDTNTSDGESDELDAFIAAKEADELDAFLAIDVAAASAAQRRRPFERTSTEPEEALLAHITLKMMDDNVRIAKDLQQTLAAAQVTGDATTGALADQNERMAKVRDRALRMEGNTRHSDKRWRQALCWCGF